MKACERDDKQGRLVVERDMQPSVRVPSALAAFTQDWNRVSQEEQWRREADGRWVCDFRIRAEGVPAKLVGTMTLEGDDSSATNNVILQIESNVPLLGRKVAKFLAADSEQKINDEYGVIRERVEG